jgi:hypothetical protein
VSMSIEDETKQGTVSYHNYSVFCRFYVQYSTEHTSARSVILAGKYNWASRFDRLENLEATIIKDSNGQLLLHPGLDLS